jgi:hypothetical protein
MAGNKVRRLPVLNSTKRLVGVVSIGDLAPRTGDDDGVGQAIQDISGACEQLNDGALDQSVGKAQANACALMTWEIAHASFIVSGMRSSLGDTARLLPLVSPDCRVRLAMEAKRSVGSFELLPPLGIVLQA